MDKTITIKIRAKGSFHGGWENLYPYTTPAFADDPKIHHNRIARGLLTLTQAAEVRWAYTESLGEGQGNYVDTPWPIDYLDDAGWAEVGKKIHYVIVYSYSIGERGASLCGEKLTRPRDHPIEFVDMPYEPCANCESLWQIALAFKCMPDESIPDSPPPLPPLAEYAIVEWLGPTINKVYETLVLERGKPYESLWNYFDPLDLAEVLIDVIVDQESLSVEQIKQACSIMNAHPKAAVLAIKLRKKQSDIVLGFTREGAERFLLSIGMMDDDGVVIDEIVPTTDGWWRCSYSVWDQAAEDADAKVIVNSSLQGLAYELYQIIQPEFSQDDYNQGRDGEVL